MSSEQVSPAEIASRLDEHVSARPQIAERIYRELLMELHRRGIVTIDRIHDEARVRTGQSPEVTDDPNQAARDRLGEKERTHVEAITREYVSRHFSLADIDDLVNVTVKRDEVRSLENVANLAHVTFRELADKVHRFAELPLGERELAPAEVVGTRVALTRHFISDQLEFIAIAKNHLRIRDFSDIVRRIIGSDDEMGRIGGKAGGMILAHQILKNAERTASVDPPSAIPESYYLRSDAIEDFLRLNRLDEYQSQKYKPIEDVVREYPLIRGVFRNGAFPLKIVQSLRRILENIGTHPLIVRSSSLLEDRIGAAFYGKYASLFLANQGPLEQRLRSLLGAIAEVYASLLAPDPILYRREHNLIDYVEDMAVLIQKVVGFRCGDYFLPAFAGVAVSRNDYRWSPRIKREDGFTRLVMGLGTRAIERHGADYPRMVALGAPTLRPESTVKEILRCAQKTLDVINLKTNRLESVRLQEVLAQGVEFPMFDKIVSVNQDDELFPPAGARVDVDPSSLCITFEKLLNASSFARDLRDRLHRLEDAYGSPIDLEYACDGERFYVLQCRMQSQTADSAPVTIPEDIAEGSVIFDAHRLVRTGLVEGIVFIVYIDALTYHAVPTRERRVQIARVIGRINRKLTPKSFILVGPGRWGSNDIRAGVPVRYADISRCRMLIEVARQSEGFLPELSFGTHFFQDLVEAGIDYLPLYPDVKGNRFNEAFMSQTPNALARIVPDDADFEREIRVIDVPAVAQGRKLTVAMDGETDHAVAYLS